MPGSEQPLVGPHLERHEGLHEPFPQATRQHHAATLGMWTFIASELLIFGALFTLYASFRFSWSQAFAVASREMDIVLGTLNTGVLLTSSLTMALAVHGARAGKRLGPTLLLLATAGMGVLFLGIKGYEWYKDYEHELVPVGGLPFHHPGPLHDGVRLFMSHYFVMTGLHALHLAIGVSIVLYLAYRLALRPPDNPNMVEMSGLYWHLVDIVWMFLYPSFYLVGRGEGP